MLVGLLLASLAVVVLAGSSRGSEPRLRTSLAEPRDPAFVVGRPPRLKADGHVSAWAPLREATVARQAPSASAQPVSGVSTATPEGTRNIVQVLRRKQRSGALWLEVRLPSGATPLRGWVPRSALGAYGFVRTHLIIDRGRLRATLLRNGRAVFETEIGVGKPSSPTPPGHFYIRNRLRRYASPLYGPIAFGTSARSDHLTDWPAGAYIGIHGTDSPDLLPGRVSHGCIRMPNPAIRELSRLMPIGTPVTVQ